MLNAYTNIGVGATIFVDDGNYPLATNIVIAAANSGLTIDGYNSLIVPPTFTGTADPERQAVLNRGNTSSGGEAIQFAGATGVTLENLQLTGGYDGLTGTGANNLLISNCQIYGNSTYGIYLDASSSGVQLAGNTVHDNHSEDIYLLGTNAIVTGNTAYNSSYGMDVEGNGSTISGNTTYGNSYGMFVSGSGTVVSGNTTYGNSSTGIYASGSPGSPVIVSGNTVSGNRGNGISASSYVQVTGNTVYNNSYFSSTVGIYLSGSAQASQNVVHDNSIGIESSNGGTVSSNRVYHNANQGIYIFSGSTSVLGNTVYSNSIGIQGGTGSPYGYYGQIANNLVYANSNEGIELQYAYNGAQVTNNTVYQPVGDAVLVQGGSQNVTLRNNILWVLAGYDLNVDPSSQIGFNSDYNDLYTTVTGKVAHWQGTDFATQADWFYRVGQDAHSFSADPQFVNPAGADGILGYSQASQGAPLTEDASSAGFSLSGPWSTQPGGVLGHNYAQSNATTSTPATATWTFSGLTPGSYFQVAISWPANNFARSSQFSVLDGGQLLAPSTNVNQTQPPADFTAAGASWKSLGIFYVASGTLTVQVTQPSSGYPVVADAVLVQPLQGDHGGDDNFHVTATSPTIDAGDPASAYLAEPAPNGDRVNLGFDGNTASATISAAQSVQVIAPAGLAKVRPGQTVAIQWQTSGLTTTNYVGLIDAGGGAVGNWVANAYQTAGSSTTNNTAINTRGVTNPAPQAVYQSYAYAANGVGQELAYSLPVPDGTYTIRLHFAEPSNVGVGGRVFDIKLQGAVARPNYDVFADAGTYDKATTQTFMNVIASGGQGIHLELVNDTANYPAILSGIELSQANPLGVASPTVNLQLSTDNGDTWTTLASGLAMDAYGHGSYSWTVGSTPTLGNTALIRVQANDGSQPTGVSQPFLIAPMTHDFYVNDSSTVGDFFTTAVGNNANSGGSPDKPVADLTTLFNAYTFGPLDVVHVDTGNYTLLQNLVIPAADAGVTIQGPTLGTGAVLNRGNTSTGSEAIQFAGATGVTLENLQLTGGYDGLTGTGANNLLISNCQIYGNSTYGIYLDASSSGVQLAGNTVHDNHSEDIYLLGTNAIVTGNTAYNSSYGIDVEGGGTISGNTTYGNSSTGIYASGSPGSPVIVSGNTVSGNRGNGISASSYVQVTGNTVYNNSYFSSTVGIYLSGSAQASQNVVHDNSIGIESSNGGTVSSNRVYHNANQGIYIFSGSTSVLGNTVYSNSIGIQGGTGSPYGYYGQIANNLVYANSNEGIELQYAYNGAQVTNNTVYQPVGDAVLVQGGSQNVTLRNNILWVLAGYDLNVDPSSQIGFNSNSNLFYKGTDPNAHIGLWNNTQYNTLAAWQAASSEGQHSLYGNPDFVNIQGSDNVLGYSTKGGGYDGGKDDNFHLSAGSPAIDAADPWFAPLDRQGRQSARR